MRIGTIPHVLRLPDPYVRPLVSIEAAGEYVGLSRRSAFRAVELDQIPTITLAGTRWVPTADLYRMLRIPLPEPRSTAAPVVDH